MLDLVGQTAQYIVAKFGRFVAHGMGAATKLIGDAAQHRSNGRLDALGNLCRAPGCAVANAL
jgi:hypothetical protein